MCHILYYLSKHKLYSLMMVLAFYSSQTANAQLIKRISKTINDATDIINQAGILADATKRTINEFNKNVTVVDGKTEQETTPGKVINPVIKNGKLTNIDWQEVIYFDGQLFPSSIICMSTYKGELTPIVQAISRPLGFRIISKSSNVAVKWEIECQDKKYFDKVSDTYIYPQANKEISLNPVIPWNYEALVKH